MVMRGRDDWAANSWVAALAGEPASAGVPVIRLPAKRAPASAIEEDKLPRFIGKSIPSAPFFGKAAVMLAQTGGVA